MEYWNLMTANGPSVWRSGDLALVQMLERHQPLWRKAVLDGNHADIQGLLRCGFTADYPLNDEGLSPLAGISQTRPRNNIHESNLDRAASILICDGQATLNRPNAKGLLPADYALASPNPLVARTVVLQTLIRESMLEHRHPYRPQFKILFALVIEPKDRAELQSHLEYNLNDIKKSLSPRMIAKNPALEALPAETLGFWHGLSVPSHMDMPKPCAALRHLFRRLSNLSNMVEENNNAPHNKKPVLNPAQSAADIRQEYLHQQNVYARRFFE